MPSMMIGKDFSPGTVRGTAVLVDLDANKPLGGFKYEARSSGTVKANETNERQKLENDLLSQFGKALTEGTQKRFPGAKTPSFFGLFY